MPQVKDSEGFTDQIGRHIKIHPRRHYAEMKAELNKNAPDCYLSIIALIPVYQDCSRCKNEHYAEEEDAESL